MFHAGQRNNVINPAANLNKLLIHQKRGMAGNDLVTLSYKCLYQKLNDLVGAISQDNFRRFNSVLFCNSFGKIITRSIWISVKVDQFLVQSCHHSG